MVLIHDARIGSRNGIGWGVGDRGGGNGRLVRARLFESSRLEKLPKLGKKLLGERRKLRIGSHLALEVFERVGEEGRIFHYSLGYGGQFRVSKRLGDLGVGHGSLYNEREIWGSDGGG